MCSNLSCKGVLTLSDTKFALILPHCDRGPTPITTAWASSPLEMRHEDSKKQSFSRVFFKSSDSPVKALSFAIKVALLMSTESAVIASPA